MRGIWLAVILTANLVLVPFSAEAQPAGKVTQSDAQRVPMLRSDRVNMAAAMDLLHVPTRRRRDFSW
jgi:hypothetical protein